MIELCVEYRIRDGFRPEDFYAELEKHGIISQTRGESGCLRYQFLLPADETRSLFLLEAWKDESAQKSHKKTEQFDKLQELKTVYVKETLLHCSAL